MCQAQGHTLLLWEAGSSSTEVPIGGIAAACSFMPTPLIENSFSPPHTPQAHTSRPLGAPTRTLHTCMLTFCNLHAYPSLTRHPYTPAGIPSQPARIPHASSHLQVYLPQPPGAPSRVPPCRLPQLAHTPAAGVSGSPCSPRDVGPGPAPACCHSIQCRPRMPSPQARTIATAASGVRLLPQACACCLRRAPAASGVRLLPQVCEQLA